jgi:PPOX class probable F420-dependent enzyme
MTTSTVAIHPAARAGEGLTGAARCILQRRLYAVLVTQNDDGTPHVAPVMFLFGDGRIAVETGAATRKARNVAARRQASVLVATPEATWVLGAGPATVVSGDEAVRHRDGIRAKYLTPEGRKACGQLLDEMDDVIVLVEPTHWRTWDLAAFMEVLAARGVDPTGAGDWFLSDS